MSKRDAEIYREAARMVAEEDWNGHPQVHWYCCEAIGFIARLHHEYRLDSLIKNFAALLGPRYADINRAWWGPGCIEANRARRVIALCLMAAIAEDDDDAA